MSRTRRSFVGGTVGMLGAAAAWRSGWARAARMADTGAAPPTAAGRAFAAAIGEKTWTDLRQRLVTVNADIRAHGLRTIPGVQATLLTGYPYNEFYDWDLYFENVYLSYYGVWTYCFTNLREFLDRQQSGRLCEPEPDQAARPAALQTVPGAVGGAGLRDRTRTTTSGCAGTITSGWVSI